MEKLRKVVNQKVDLKILTSNYINESVIKWYSDEDVIKYSENQYRKINLVNQIEYVESCYRSNTEFLYGILSDGQYIGNILLSNISKNHKTAELSYLIGDKNFWGKGIITEAINLIIKIAINHLKLRKLYAGVCSENIGSIKALEKNNFVKEGIRIKHLYLDSRFHDQIDYGLLLIK